MSQSRDPRSYQIATLVALVVYGLIGLDLEIQPGMAFTILIVALAAQLAGTRLAGLPRFDPKSALISSLSLCLLLRTDSLVLAAITAVVTIASKFLLRIDDRHMFNPTNFGLAVMMALGTSVWVSPGQWGTGAFFAFLLAGCGGLVIRRAARSDVTYAFIGFYSAIVFARAAFLGDPSRDSPSPSSKRRVPLVRVLHDLGSQDDARFPSRPYRVCSHGRPRSRLGSFRLVPTERIALVSRPLGPYHPFVEPAASRPALPVARTFGDTSRNIFRKELRMKRSMTLLGGIARLRSHVVESQPSEPFAASTSRKQMSSSSTRRRKSFSSGTATRPSSPWSTTFEASRKSSRWWFPYRRSSSGSRSM